MGWRSTLLSFLVGVSMQLINFIISFLRKSSGYFIGCFHTCYLGHRQMYYISMRISSIAEHLDHRHDYYHDRLRLLRGRHYDYLQDFVIFKSSSLALNSITRQMQGNLSPQHQDRKIEEAGEAGDQEVYNVSDPQSGKSE